MTPKATIKPEKKERVVAIAERMKGSKSVVFVDYTGMTVSTVRDLRERLGESGGSMLVAKNTLFRIAGKNAGLPDEAVNEELLSGQTAAIFAENDAVSPIQTLGKFISEFEMPRVKAAIVEGSFQGAESVIRISKLPDKQGLYSQTVGAVSSPMYGLIGALQGNLQKLVYVIKQASENK